MKFDHLRAIRTYELWELLQYFPDRSRVLEIGAGSGWQADYLRRAGFRVAAIDVPTSGYGSVRMSRVVSYDGVHIPFRDAEFDVIFSSNVLEHIAHVEDFQTEIRRVLKPDGTAIHVLPTATWRLWTCLTHYFFILQEVFLLVSGRSRPDEEQPAHRRGRIKYGLTGMVIRAVLPARHGEKGSTLSEVYLFSRLRWCRLFKRQGWVVRKCFPVRLFYTGYSILDQHFSIRARHLVSYLLGSSCLVFVLGNSVKENGE